MRVYLQKAMPFGVEGPLALQHELILLRVYVLIGKVHGQTLQTELHVRLSAPTGARATYMLRVSLGGRRVDVLCVCDRAIPRICKQSSQTVSTCNFRKIP